MVLINRILFVLYILPECGNSISMSQYDEHFMSKYQNNDFDYTNLGADDIDFALSLILDENELPFKLFIDLGELMIQHTDQILFTYMKSADMAVQILWNTFYLWARI